MQLHLERASITLQRRDSEQAAKKSRRPVSPRLLWCAGGILLLIVVWQVLAATTHSAIVASPAQTWAALSQLAASGQLTSELAITLRRLVIALALGSAVGFSLGLASGFSRACRALLEPMRWVTMTLPTVFLAILGLLWFGIGDSQVVFLVSIIVAPVMYVNTLSGFDTLDPQLVEMARVYRFTRWQRLKEVYLPGIGVQVMTGLTVAAGIGVRAVLMAELLGASEGIGHSFNRAWTFLKTPEMFAWMLASLALMALLEFGIFKPLRRTLTHWQRASA